MNSVKFKTKPSGGGPVFMASYPSGDVIEPWEPSAGDAVALHSGDVTVLAEITSSDSRKYKGRVIGFENWNQYEYDGLEPGGEVEFTYENVFGCSH